MSSLQRDTRKREPPSPVTVGDLQREEEQEIDASRRTYAWLTDFQEKKEERLREATQETKQAN